MKNDYTHKRGALFGGAVLVCAMLVFGCQDSSIPVGPDVASDADSPASLSKHKEGHDPPGGGGGGGGGEVTLKVTMAGGLLTASAQAVDTKRDNKRSLFLTSNPFTVETNLANTHAEAVKLLNEDPFTLCEPFAPDNLDQATKNALVAELD